MAKFGKSDSLDNGISEKYMLARELLSPKNMSLKANINNYVASAILAVIAEYAEERGFIRTANVYKSFDKQILERSISQNGLSREQIIRMASTIPLSENVILEKPEDKGKRRETINDNGNYGNTRRG